MTLPEKAAAFAVSVAKDDSHGYDQGRRWGPDYDCSSLVITAWKQAGVPLTCTYTGNMAQDFLAKGFTDVTKSIALATGAGLQTGDVLLNHRQHTALYVGNGQIVQAGGNENGGITGGRTGDQTGREIRVMGYYSHPWDCVLRYTGKEKEPEHEEGTSWYTVVPGDTLWGIAARYYGTGSEWTKIRDDNALSSTAIYPGQKLKMNINHNIIMETNEEGENTCSVVLPVHPQNENMCSVELPVLRQGDESMEVYTMQVLLADNGFSLPEYGCDGIFGEETLSALKNFQTSEAVPEWDVCGPLTWKSLICG